MSEIKVEWPDAISDTEFNLVFIQGMANRMATSFYKYGTIKDSAPQVDYLFCIKERLRLYEETGNTEWLMDVANMAMIEFSFPSHPNAHFRQTGSEESPGRRFYGEHKNSPRHALDFET